MAQRDPSLTLADARSRLRAAGLRCTPARIQVLQQLSAMDRPVSHADVAEVLAPVGFDKSTIFRCLVELSDAGLAVRLDLGDQVRRFELRGGDDPAGCNHAHFMCVDCGKIECLDDYEVQVASRKGRRLPNHDITEVLVRGHCPTCR